MPRPFQLAAALALTLLPAACSSAGSAGAGPATAWVATDRQVASAPEAVVPSPPTPPPLHEVPGKEPRQRVATPLTALSQMVTTQALLVSLLLAPVATEAVPPANAASKAAGTPR